MADFYPLLSKAVAGLPDPAPANRQAIYERARGALLAQLNAANPAAGQSIVDAEFAALEQAIQRVENELTPPQAAQPAPVAPITPPPRRPGIVWGHPLHLPHCRPTQQQSRPKLRVLAHTVKRLHRKNHRLRLVCPPLFSTQIIPKHRSPCRLVCLLPQHQLQCRFPPVRPCRPQYKAPKQLQHQMAGRWPDKLQQHQNAAEWAAAWRS